MCNREVRGCAVLVVAMAALIVIPKAGHAQVERQRGMGARPPTPAEQAYIDAVYTEVREVAPNALAVARAQKEAAPLRAGLPSAVDNSTLQYFPPIRSQGMQGSCTAWASCYYWNTFEQAFDEGFDVSGGDNDHICSPAFIYPLTNDGMDEGASTQYVMGRINDVGCSSWTLKPYSESDYTSWPSEEAWVQALDSRTLNPHMIDGSTQSGLDAIKQHLANGKLIVTDFEVYATWYYEYPDDSQTGIDNDVYYCQDGDYLSGHAVTLVGYDDNRSYTDHRDETTHYGAFLVANSWGDSWGVPNSTGTSGNGFFWVAYEMFLDQSFGPYCYYNDDRPDYRPTLYGVLGVNHPERWDLELYGGVGDPPDWYSQYTLYYEGGWLPVSDDKRIAVDLTDGVPQLGSPGEVFVEAYVYEWSYYSATITSAEFFEDLDGDGTYANYESTDPTLTIAPGYWDSAYATLEHSFSVTAATPSPATVTSGGTTSLSASFTDTAGHGVASWSWHDGGAGGSFSPSASVQNPTYTAPANAGSEDIIVTLTVNATCDGLEQLSDSDSTTLTVQPVPHEFEVTANEPDPPTVLFGGSTSLSASYSDTKGHGVASWSWDDGGAGGSFSPSASVQNPTYMAPASGGDELVVTLTASAMCDGPEPLGDSDSTTLYVSSVVHTLTVTAAAPDPATVASGGSTSLSATYEDSMGHSVGLWEWDDGGAGGIFDPSATVQEPQYFAPINSTGSDLVVTLTVTGTCDGPVPVSDSDTTTLTVEPMPGPRFTDIGAIMNIPSAAGGAWGDYDDDGDPDLFVGGVWQDHRCVLYRNDGDGTFTDVTSAMGLHTDSASWEDWGAAWGDFNNDGRLDLIVMGGNHMPFLYRNDGDHFTDVGGEAAGFNPQWSVLRGVAWGDYDADGWLDVYTSIDYYGAPSRLYRNNHDGTFTEVTEICGMEFAPVYYGQSAAWFDFDNDALLDLVVARKEEATGEGSPARMYRNNGDGTFNDWAAVGDLQNANTCHGVAPGDYNNDGYVDLAFTPARNRPAWLFENNGDGAFTDVSSASGVEAVNAESYGVAWGDYDNDTYLDLFMAFGSSAREPFLFRGSASGVFSEVAAAEGVTSQREHRTACWADFDLDGDLDLFAAAAENYSCLYENEGTVWNWLRVRALTDRDGDTQDANLEEDRDALGARVEVNIENDDTFSPGTTLTRVIDGGSSFCGQNEPIAQFGVGAATTVAVRVTFVDGTVVVETDVAANQQITVRDECQQCGWAEGVVTDAWSGTPIASATVELDGESTTTDADGAYVFGEVMPGSYTVTASAVGYYPEAASGVAVTTGAGTVTDLALTPEWGSITGTVRDASTGDPIAEATVTSAEASTTTEADGTYLLTEVRAGSRTVTASRQYYLTGVVTGVPVVEGQTIQVDFDLLAAGSIAGTVTDVATGSPVGGATVICEGASATTAADGTYTLTGVQAGSGLLVHASAPGYREHTITGVTVVLGETTIVDIALGYARGAIAGRVTDATTGLPITGAAVECDGRAFTSSADGRYRFGELRAAQTYTVAASADAHSPASVAGVMVDANETSVVDLALDPTETGALAGTVTDADSGEPIAGALVTCGNLSAETGGDGSYAIADVPAGSASVVGASAGGYLWGTARDVPVTAATLTTVDFALAPLPSESIFEVIQYEGDWWPQATGAAWGDYDEDGYPDLLLTGTPSGQNPDIRLFRNQGDLTFVDVGAEVGLYGGTHGPTDGVAWADYDNDGNRDVLISGDGNTLDKLLRYDGAFFTDVSESAGFTEREDPGRTVSWCDYDGDNWLDVFISYVSYPGYDVKGRLYRNEGDGTFTDMTERVGMGGDDASMYAFGSHWGDYDNDSWSDLLVASWNLPPMLYHNEGDATFTEVGSAAHLAILSGGTGAAWADYDNDGWLDCYVVANGQAMDGLFHNNGDGTFTNVAATAGMGGDNFKANAVSWADYDNDGFLDIVVGGDSNTIVALYHNNGNGTFSNAASEAGLVAPQHSGSAVWADIDLDGRLDLFHGANPDSILSHNVGAGGNWLRVRALTDADGDACDDDRSDDRDALSVRVELNVDNNDLFPADRTLIRVIDGGSGFLGQNEPVAQFGVPVDGPVAVRVLFADGSVVTHRDVSLNRQIVIRDVSDDRVVETFADVPLDFWAYEHIDACMAAGVVAGYDDGLYHGDWAVTRAQMAVFIARAMAGGDAYIPDGSGTLTFWDVPETYWAYDHIAYAVAQGVVQGYPEGDYRPDMNVDRAAMAVYIARALCAGDDSVPDAPGTATFPDVASAFWAYKYVEYCVDAEIVRGYDDGCYHPEIVVTRDQMAVYIARAFELLP